MCRALTRLLVALLVAGLASSAITAQQTVNYQQAARTTAAWTSATSGDTRASVQVGPGYASVTVTLHATTTMTGGALTFEADDDQDNTTWYPVQCVRTNAFTAESTFTLSVTDQAWTCAVSGWARFAVRLSMTITGSGTATVGIVPTAAPGPQRITVGQSAAASNKVDPSGVTSPVSGTVTANAGTGSFTVAQSTASNLKSEVTNAGTFATQATLQSGSNQIGHLEANQSVNVAQINGVTPLMGAGNTGTGSPRVTIVTDQAALTGLAIYTEDAAETAGGNLSMVGSVRRDTQASSAGTSGDNATINTDDSGNLWARMADPCTAYAKTFVPISINTAATTVVISASASNKNYICSLELVAAGADNVALVEDATGSCASPDAGMAGGTTAATGWNFAANSGIARGNGNGTVYKSASTNVNVCLITSAAVQLSGVLSYVQKP